MLETLCQPTAEVIAAIESLRPALPLQPTPLRIEDCTTPELRMRFLLSWLDRGAPECGDVAGFCMETFFWRNGMTHSEPRCGTVCCLAGSVISWWGMGGKSYCEVAAELLGIPKNTARRLFIPGNSAIETNDPAWAARCIRKYQKTGVVDWEGTRHV